MKIKIYLLPGIMCNENLWSKLSYFFDDSYEFVHVAIPLKDNFDAIIEELELLLPQEPIFLLGFSLGGYVASYYAAHYPNRVAKLLLVGNSPCSISQEEIQKRKQAIEFTHNYRFKGLSRQKVQSLLEEKNQNNEALIGLIQEMYVLLGEKVYKTQIKATLHRRDLFDSLLELPVPITFFYSVHDRLVDIFWLKKFEEVSHENVFIKNSGSSHMLPLEKPKELAQVIQNWVN